MEIQDQKEVVAKAIMKHAGLSHWDRFFVDQEVDAIFKALKKNKLKIIKES